ncbi:MAG: hypothetical protein M1835_003459 [Candelina submexicana]|nr:MAG: hypothetical protein M1835_003459 [Candelina submexicana]
MEETPEQPPKGSQEPKTPSKKKENTKQKISNVVEKIASPFRTSTPSPHQVPLPDSVPPEPSRRPKSPFRSLGRSTLNAMIPRFLPTLPQNLEALRATQPTSPEPTAQEAEELMVTGEIQAVEDSTGQGPQGKSSTSSENRSYVPHNPPAPPRSPGLPTPSTQPDWEQFLAIPPLAPKTTASSDIPLLDRPYKGSPPVSVPERGDSSSLRTMGTVPYRSLDTEDAVSWTEERKYLKKPLRSESQEAGSLKTEMKGSSSSDTNPYPKDEHGVATPERAKEEGFKIDPDVIRSLAASAPGNSQLTPIDQWEDFDDVHAPGQKDQTKPDVAGQSDSKSDRPLEESIEPHDAQFVGGFAHLSEDIPTSQASPQQPRTPAQRPGTVAPHTTPYSSTVNPPLDLPFRKTPPSQLVVGQQGSALTEGLLRQKLEGTLYPDGVSSLHPAHNHTPFLRPPPSIPSPPATLSPPPSHIQRLNTDIFDSRQASITTMSSAAASVAPQGDGKGNAGEGSSNAAQFTENSPIGPAWPKPVKRDNKEVARHRKLILSGIPPDSSAHTIHTLVFYGALEEIQYNPPSNRAIIYFIHADDCDRYFNSNPNGIALMRNFGTQHQPNIREHIIFVNRAPEPSPVGGALRAMIQEGATRCIRVSGVGMEWGDEGLWKLAEAGGKWKVENVLVDEVKGTSVGKGGVESSYQIVTFRFCSLAHAKMFMGMINRKEEWEHCNVQFAEDP